MGIRMIDPDERKRLQKLLIYEEQAFKDGFNSIAGIDEAGRGPLAGPVVAAACIIPKGVFFSGINDSKQLTALERDSLFDQITSHQDVIFGIGIIEPAEIDQINIFQATIRAMCQAIRQLSTTPDFLLVDGLKLPHTIPSLKIIKGDTLSQSIAAASVIAKVTRDNLMCRYHEQWPHYGFAKHKGYGTPEHLLAIKQHGICAIHRKSFSPCKDAQLDLQCEFNFLI